MTEREMLELAAKACGIDGEWSDLHNAIAQIRGHAAIPWSPLKFIADCADMEARLMIDVNWTTYEAICFAWDKRHGRIIAKVVEAFSDHNNDRQQARMMASTRAAAALAEGVE